jgi:hypothetical protein
VLVVAAKDLGLGTDYDVRIATLDADPTTAISGEIYLSLGCLGDVPFGWLTPYTLVVPADIDTFAVGIWDRKSAKFVDDIPDQPAVRNDDESSLTISNRVVLRGVTRLLRQAASGLPQGQVLTAGMWKRGAHDIGMWADFDADGLQDALDYLGCF